MYLIDAIRVKIREKTNPYFSKFRRKKLKSDNFTIISNNCWAGHVYRYFGIQYLTPTIGLFFYSSDFIKLCNNLKYYMDCSIKFISVDESKYKDRLIDSNIKCPIGLLDDIEIIFLHYKSEEEALEKWNRRVKRINWDNICIKNSEQNYCDYEDILNFDKIKYNKKIIFVTKNYNIKSQIIWRKKCDNEISNDTILFNKYVNLYDFINGDSKEKNK